jgi:hypothetical protein
MSWSHQRPGGVLISAANEECGQKLLDHVVIDANGLSLMPMV